MAVKKQSPEYLEGISAWKEYEQTGINKGNPYTCLTPEWYEFSRGWCRDQKHNLKK